MASTTIDEFKEYLDSSSRVKAERAAQIAGQSQQNFDVAAHVALYEPYPLSMRASWAMVICCEKYPKLFEKHLASSIQNLSKLNASGVRRNFLTILSKQNIPENLQGELLNHCFDFVLSPQEPVAVKANALQVIANHLKYYPDLKNELKAIIDNQRDKTTIAFWAKGRKILTKIRLDSK